MANKTNSWNRLVAGTVLIFLLAVFVPNALAQGYGQVAYRSPDGSCLATVIPIHVKNASFGEYAVEIRNGENNLILKKDYSSRDHEHGSSILQAAWTPDSKFFVFSTTSSGGHSSWHFPTFVYVRSLKKIIYLDDFLETPLVEPNFNLTGPALFHSKMNNWKNEKQFSEEPVPVQADLNKMPFK